MAATWQLLKQWVLMVHWSDSGLHLHQAGAATTLSRYVVSNKIEIALRGCCMLCGTVETAHQHLASLFY